MRKVTAGILGMAVLCAGTVGSVAAAEEGGVAAMLNEMYSMEYMQMTETMSMEMTGAQMDAVVSFQMGAGCLTDVDMSFTINVPEQNLTYQMELEDMVRVLPDGCYINAGEFIEAVEVLAGEGSMASLTDMIGLTEPWIAIPASDLAGFPYEKAAALFSDIQSTLFSDLTMFNDADAIEGGYQITMDAQDYIGLLEDILIIADENLASWIEELIAVVRELDIPETVNPYLKAVMEGISEVDPSVDPAAADGVIEEALTAIGYPDCLDTLSVEIKNLFDEAKAEAEAQGITWDTLAEQLSSQLDLAALEGMTEYTWSIVETDGGYTITTGETMMMDTEEVSVEMVMTAVPVDPVEVSAPETCVELKQLVKGISGFVYQMMEMQSETYEGAELQIDGNRVLVTNYDETMGYWVSYDSQALSVDTASSAPYCVFFDLADYSNYVMISLVDHSNFADVCASEVELCADYYTSYSATEIAVSTAGGVDLQYCFVDVWDEDNNYRTLYFGTDIGEGRCLAGSLNVNDETDEEALVIMHQAIAGLEEFVVE